MKDKLNKFKSKFMSIVKGLIKKINENRRVSIIILCVVLFLILIIVLMCSVKVDQVTGKEIDYGTSIFPSSEEFEKLLNNKDEIESVMFEERKNGVVTTKSLNVDEAFETISNLKVGDEVEEENEYGVIYYTYYIFKLKDGAIYNIYFEGPYLHYGDKNYTVEGRE